MSGEEQAENAALDAVTARVDDLEQRVTALEDVTITTDPVTPAVAPPPTDVDV